MKAEIKMIKKFNLSIKVKIHIKFFKMIIASTSFSCLAESDLRLNTSHYTNNDMRMVTSFIYLSETVHYIDNMISTILKFELLDMQQLNAIIRTISVNYKEETKPCFKPKKMV